MLHLLSGTHEAKNLCKDVVGTDRGQDAKIKCEENYTDIVNILNTYVIQISSKILTKEEIEDMKNGGDIYLSTEEVKARLLRRG